MASKSYVDFKYRLSTGLFDWLTDDVRIILCMSDHTVDTEDVLNLSAFSDLDEYDGAGYTVGGVVLTTKTAVRNFGAPKQADLDAANVAFGSIGAGTRSVTAILVYHWDRGEVPDPPTNYNKAYPAFTQYDVPDMPFNGDGSSPISIVWDGSGALLVK